MCCRFAHVPVCTSHAPCLVDGQAVTGLRNRHITLPRSPPNSCLNSATCSSRVAVEHDSDPLSICVLVRMADNDKVPIVGLTSSSRQMEYPLKHPPLLRYAVLPVNYFPQAIFHSK